MPRKPSLATTLINAGTPSKKDGHQTIKDGDPFKQGPQFASAFHLAGDVDPNAYQYGRFSHPNWEALEQGLSALEGGETIVFPSGMSAAAAILTSLVNAGDTVLLPNDGYAPVKHYTQEYLVKFGVTLKTIATHQVDDFDFVGIDVALLETPSNPMLDTFDIKLAAQKIHQQGGILAIDNTTLTFLGQDPLALGADISMCADTKALNGHSDVLFGHVSTNNTSIAQKVRDWRKYSGNIPGPMETWLVHRSLPTLDVRMQRMCDTALALATELSAHPKIKSIRYPGLSSDPSYRLASMQQQLYGFLISFELSNKSAAQTFLSACTLVYEATSFGGVHSTAERRARWGTDNISESVIRFSVGCERFEDLRDDVFSALDKID